MVGESSQSIKVDSHQPKNKYANEQHLATTKKKFNTEIALLTCILPALQNEIIQLLFLDLQMQSTRQMTIRNSQTTYNNTVALAQKKRRPLKLCCQLQG